MPAFVFQNGPRAGERVPIGAGDGLVVGCLESCALYVPDESVIGRHAQIKEHKGRYFIKDFARDTHINDSLISTAEIHQGDLLRVGKTLLVFVADRTESTDAPAPAGAALPAPGPTREIRSTEAPDLPGGLPPRSARGPSEVRPISAKANGSSASLVGRTVGGYQILEQLGRGGMGTVYRALQLSLDREVALKVLAPRLTRDTQFVEQFVREARAAGQLNHPNIVQVFDVGRDGPLYFYSMEFMPAGTVGDRIDREGALPPAEALRVVTDAARALEYAELKGIVHRDIKPGNLMMTELGHVKLADLGLARSLRDTAARDPEGILGTPHFISPEQAQRKDADIRSDIYSLGATFFMLLAGRPPFQGRSAREIILKQIREDPRPLSEVCDDVPERIADLVAQMMSKDPEDRPSSGAELVERLQAIAQHRGRKMLFLMVLALLVVASGVVAGVIHYNRPEPEVIIKETRTGVDPDLLVQERSRAQQLALELEARVALTHLGDENGAGSAQKLEGAARARALRELAARYPDTRAAEEAASEAERISRDLERRRETEEKLEEKKRAILGNARDAVNAALGTGRFSEAMRFAARVGVGGPMADDAAITALRKELTGKVGDTLRARAADLVSRAEECLGSADFDGASKHIESLAELGRIGPPEAGEAPLPEGDLAVFTEIASDAAKRLAAIEQARVDKRAADLAHDRRLTAGILRDVGLADVALNLAFRPAARSIADRSDGLLTAGYRDYLQDWNDLLERLAALQDRLIESVSKGALVTEQIQVPGETRVGKIIGLADGGGGLRIEYPISGGTVGQNIQWEKFSVRGGLVDLYANHLGLAGEDLVDLAFSVLLADEARWLAHLDGLFDLLGRYDPARGWGQSEWNRVAGLDVSPPDLQALRNLLDRARRKTPASPRAAALEARLTEESEAMGLLSRALVPYLAEDTVVGFTEAAEALSDLVSRHPASLLLALAYDYLDDGTDSISLLPERP